MKKSIISFIIMFIILFCFYLIAYAVEIHLAWDANDEDDNVISYKLHWTSSGSRYKGFTYDNSQDVGDVTNYYLEVGSEAWIAVTATNDDGESGYSRELHYHDGRTGRDLSSSGSIR